MRNIVTVMMMLLIFQMTQTVMQMATIENKTIMSGKVIKKW